MNAIISECRKYRYQLTREGDMFADRPPVLFVMLNPSKADAEIDDHTIRRCKGFIKQWGCKGFMVVNLYAFRATDPRELFKAEDPVGADNDFHIRNAMSIHGDVVCAWGNNAKEDRVKEFMKIAKGTGARLWHLGLTKPGQPRHPLMVKSAQELILWDTQNG